jgi:hypothetical protein
MNGSLLFELPSYLLYPLFSEWIIYIHEISSIDVAYCKGSERGKLLDVISESSRKKPFLETFTILQHVFYNKSYGEKYLFARRIHCERLPLTPKLREWWFKLLPYFIKICLQFHAGRRSAWFNFCLKIISCGFLIVV